MPGRSATVKWLLVVALEALCVVFSPAQTASSSPSPARPIAAQKLTVIVTDENGLAVSSARVQLQPPPPALPLRCGTDFAGRCEFTDLSPGTYELRVEQTDFYAAVQSDVQVGVTANVDVTLSHQREARKVVNVVESAPAIDPEQISTKEELSAAELIDIPSPGPHDYRNALLFMPGVTPDAYGQAHVAGAETYQTLLLLDGFNVTQPTSGALVVQTSVDSFRSVAVTPSREPAEFGKGSGGVMALNTRMGNDHFRFLATDFIPAPQDIKGISLANWTPIYTLAGPIRKGKMWFFDALDGEYDNYITKQLPSGDDADKVWRMDNLLKLQSNLTTRNIVTASFLSDYFHDPNAGMWALMPQSTTPSEVETASLGSLKDQYYFRGGALLDTGFGVDQYNLTLTPHGDAGYIETILATGGNYYLRGDSSARREQGLANLYFAPYQWHGRHDIKFGADLNRLNYDAQFLRQPISFVQSGPPQPCPTDSNGFPIVPEPTCARYSVVTGGDLSTIYNAEASSYAEDRWLITNRLLIEPGVRFDWDEIVRTPLFSPRLAGTYIFDDESNTKLSAGIGITYDATSLGLIHQALDGQRVDYAFDSNGCPEEANGESVKCTGLLPGTPEPAPIPLPTGFVVNRSTLAAPRYLNWSVGFEKKLPQAIFLKLAFIEKPGVYGFAYKTLTGAVEANVILESRRDDRYDAFTVSLRHRFRQHYEIFGAYTRSRSRTNQVFDFSLDLPVLSQQLPGPYPWDAPNRFVGYGVLPFFKLPIVHKVDLVYSAEARTGLPVNATLETGAIYAPDPPGTFRLPTYYTVNLEFGKRIHLFGRYWEVRAGFDNVTNPADAMLSNGIINPPTQPVPIFIDGNGRALDGRIRYLGKQ